MAMLLFYVGNNRFVIENQFIVKIIPSIHLEAPLYGAPYLVGLLNWKEHPVPIVDFCQIIERRAASKAFHSRIILIQKEQSQDQYAGILGEKITEIVDLQPSDFVEGKMYQPNLSFLDGIHSDEEGIIQRVDVMEFFKFLTLELSLKGK
ncbi:chemotaxis protein CheW [Candidatus Protochlamydia phocaeensis]|uniref:chemotaxis protein CheW n=1 Tax=Candidatus Protochlamydia phocaeensis TaxID=1414722 RepID=UPI0008392C8D|nr:chemotaxis protein CheW [Candidatus Protochlamydia phocaeensis]